MTAPLYESCQAPKKCEGNLGLWFERFFDQYNSTDWKVLQPETKNSEPGDSYWLRQHFNNKKAGHDQHLEQQVQAQMQLTDSLQGQNHVFKASWHFVTGMGNPHPVENGFAWHPTLGVPYLTGAAVKGLVRSYIENNLDTDNADNPDKKKLLLQWFGSDHKDPKEQTYDSQAGQLIFFDALPIKPVTLGVDIMTPHMGKWYEKGCGNDANKPETVPADWHAPVPVSFLVAKEISLLFSFALRPYPEADSKRPAIDLADVADVLMRALANAGAGGKTATGYGGMEPDEKILQDKAEALEKRRLEQEKAAQLNAELATLSPLAAAFKKQESDENWEQNRDVFVAPSMIEGWLERLEEENDAFVVERLVALVSQHFSEELLENPDATKGKKGKEKPVFKERQQKIAKRLNQLRS